MFKVCLYCLSTGLYLASALLFIERQPRTFDSKVISNAGAHEMPNRSTITERFINGLLLIFKPLIHYAVTLQRQSNAYNTAPQNKPRCWLLAVYDQFSANKKNKCIFNN